jgi:predicted CXXCH cytochrome family protein
VKSRALAYLAFPVLLAACAGVLGIRPGAASHPFEHRAHVLKGIACLECHSGVPTAGDVGPLHIPSKDKCLQCHQKPHDSRTCNDCHGEAYIRQGAELARASLRFDHSKHVPVVKGNCMECHTAVGEAKPEALRPTMPTCFGCHQHSDQWRARDCDACHTDLGTERTPPASHLVHDGDWIREHGTRAASSRDLCSTCHSERACAMCHGQGTVAGLPARLRFDEVPLSGLHRAGFRSRHSDEARANPGLCTTCHAENTCVECHTTNSVAPGNATRRHHPPGWLSPLRGGDHGREARIDPAACAGCHSGAGEQLCVDCHKVGGPGGNPHGPGFSSTKNKTQDVPCRMCHSGL